MPATKKLERVIRAIKELDDPRVVYVGRRTDKRQIRVQLDVKLPLAQKFLEVMKQQTDGDGEPDNDGDGGVVPERSEAKRSPARPRARAARA